MSAQKIPKKRTAAKAREDDDPFFDDDSDDEPVGRAREEAVDVRDVVADDVDLRAQLPRY